MFRSKRNLNILKGHHVQYNYITKRQLCMKDSYYRPVAEPCWVSEMCVIENRETIKRLSDTAAGLGASGLLEMGGGED